jgi:TrmH family RNA methyltransferase
MSLISSLHNDRVKHVRALQRQAKVRRRARQLVLEGARLIEDALRSGARPDFAFYDEESALARQMRDLGVPCWPVTAALLREMGDTETPQGVLAVFPWPDLPVPAAPDLVVVADGWRDPGNLGTLIRTAAAAGVDLVAVTPGTVDPTNPKTLRAGMGAHFRVPVRAWDELHYPHHTVIAADAAGATPLYDVDWTRPTILVIGGEAHGIGGTARAEISVRIPMVAGVESLNAAIAASVLIYEARRHRFKM